MTEALSKWFQSEAPKPPEINPIEGKLIRYNHDFDKKIRVDFSKLSAGAQSTILLTTLVAHSALQVKFALTERSETAKRSSENWAEKSFKMGMEGAGTAKWWTEKTGLASTFLTFMGPIALEKAGGPLSSSIRNMPYGMGSLFPDLTQGQTLSDWKKRMQGMGTMIQQFGQGESQVASAEAQSRTAFGSGRQQVFHDGTQQASQAKGEVGQVEQQAREAASKVLDASDQTIQRIISSMG